MIKFSFLLVSLSLLGIVQGNAQYTVLHNFTGVDGANPWGSLTISQNKLYGMTLFGGANHKGCIFSVNTNGNGYKVLINFNGMNTPLGGNPYGSLILSGGTLYGMTCWGGAKNRGCIFSLDTNGSGYTDLHDFNDSLSGTNPHGSLTLFGNILYGMTLYGSIVHGVAGNIFSLHTDGSGFKKFNVIGQLPYGSLTLSGSELFGMTEYGNSYGNIFSTDTNGNNSKDLWNFNGMPLDTGGIYPYGSLILSGNVLYGMASTGGLGSGNGLIFSIDTDGVNFRHMHDFNGYNGNSPSGSLILLGSMLYGMTFDGFTAHQYGNIFSLNITDTAYTDLYDFNGAQGANPYGDLILSGNTLYGMTSSGGTNDSGVIFSFTKAGLGINNLTSKSEIIKLYPNPNNGTFTLSFSNVNAVCNVEVYNILGDKVYTESLPQSESANTINLTGQPNGIYLYRVIANTGELIGEGKLVIQK